jgi:hypothetical protein
VIELKSLRVALGETVKVSNQWAAETEKRGTTVSSSAWEYVGGSATLASAALSTPLASTLVTPTSSGELQNTVVLANGETLIAVRRVVVP